MDQFAVSRVLLAKPRGFCAGVVRAIEVVEKCLELYGAPVYVYHEIVHNKHVVERLKEEGAVFVEQVEDAPLGSTLVFSAHGISPEVRRAAEGRNMVSIDATCPLVTKVHREAIKFAQEGYSILLVGHEGHQEVVGTMGEAPDRIQLVETAEDVATVQIDDPDRVAVITQTTLSIDDTSVVIDAIKERFPNVTFPPKEDICYATTNRQGAVKQLAPEVDLVLVIGSQNSSNSRRLAEVAKTFDVPAYLIDDVTHIDPTWFTAAVKTVGVTAGASAPERLVQAVVDYFREHGVEDITDFVVIPEDMRFGLPVELRKAIKAQEAIAS